MIGYRVLFKKFPAVCMTGSIITVVRQSPPPVPMLTHISPMHVTQSYFLNVCFNNILPSAPRYEALHSVVYRTAFCVSFHQEPGFEPSSLTGSCKAFIPSVDRTGQQVQSAEQ